MDSQCSKTSTAHYRPQMLPDPLSSCHRFLMPVVRFSAAKSHAPQWHLIFPTKIRFYPPLCQVLDWAREPGYRCVCEVFWRRWHQTARNSTHPSHHPWHIGWVLPSQHQVHGDWCVKMGRLPVHSAASDFTNLAIHSTQASLMPSVYGSNYRSEDQAFYQTKTSAVLTRWSNIVYAKWGAWGTFEK